MYVCLNACVVSGYPAARVKGRKIQWQLHFQSWVHINEGLKQARGLRLTSAFKDSNPSLKSSFCLILTLHSLAMFLSHFSNHTYYGILVLSFRVSFAHLARRDNKHIDNHKRRHGTHRLLGSALYHYDGDQVRALKLEVRAQSRV